MRIHGHVGFKIFKVNTKIQHGLVSLFRNLFALNERAYRTWTARYCTEKKRYSFKSSPDQSHSIFEINVGKEWIRHITTLKLIDELQIQSRPMSDPHPSDIDFKNKTA